MYMASSEQRGGDTFDHQTIAYLMLRIALTTHVCVHVDI